MSTPRIFETKSFEKTAPWMAFSYVLLIYLLFPTKNFYWDGIEFASVIEAAPALNASLFHPNHLFYNLVGYLGYQLAKLFSPATRAITVLQILNSLFSVSAAVWLFFILKNLLGRLYPSLALSLIFAFSATWWKFSTDANSYVPSVLFLLISFYFILPNQPPRPLTTALTHSAAMFFHQLALFFFPVIVLGIFLQTKNEDGRKRILLVLQYAFASFFITFGTFCFSYYLLTGTFDLKEFFRWVTWFSSENGFLFDVGRSFFLTARGMMRLFLDGRFRFLEVDPLNLILFGLLAISFCLLLFKLGRDRQSFKAAVKTIFDHSFFSHPVFLLCAVWIVFYLVFLFFFIPGNTFYRLFYLPALILLFGLLLGKSNVLESSTRHWRLALLTAIIFLANFLFFIRPYSRVMPDTPLSLTMKMQERWSEKTVVYYDSFNSDNRLVRYFNPATTWIRFDSVDGLKIKIEEIYRQNGTVWLETSLLEKLKSSKLATEQLPENLIEKERVELVNDSYNLQFVRIAPASLEHQSF